MLCVDIISVTLVEETKILTEIKMFVGTLSLQNTQGLGFLWDSLYRLEYHAHAFDEKSIGVSPSRKADSEIGDSPSDNYVGIHNPIGIRDLWIVNPAGGETTVLFNIP